MKQIRMRVLVVSIAVIAISLAVIAFRPVIKDIQFSIFRRRIRRERIQRYEQQLRRYNTDDIVEKWLREHKWLGK